MNKSWFLIIILIVSPCSAQIPYIPLSSDGSFGGFYQQAPDFSKAQKLEESGNIEDAIKTYLSIPGGEQSAALLAVTHPEKSFKLLKTIQPDESGAAIRANLVIGDLHFAKGEKDQALQYYRKFTSAIADRESKNGWKEMRVPYGYHPTYSTSNRTNNGPHRGQQLLSQISESWNSVLYSRSDSWLISRFVSLEAWEDVTKEFDRIQHHHDLQAGSPSRTALQFTLNHAIYLIKQERENEALDLLRRYLLKLDHSAHSSLYHFDNYSHHRSILTDDEFIRLSYGAFKNTGRTEELVKALRSSGNVFTLEVLAKVKHYEGETQEALKLKLEYLDEISLSVKERAYRKGLVYMDFNDLTMAASEFEKVKTQLIKANKRVFINIHPQNSYLDIWPHLEKCYTATGQQDQLLKTKLENLQYEPHQIGSIYITNNIPQLAKNIGKSEVFDAWVDEALLNNNYSLPALANLNWYDGNFQKAIDLLGEEEAKNEKTHKTHWRFEEWMKRFQKHGDEALTKTYLTTLIASNPNEASYHFEFVKLLGSNPPDAAVIAFYECLLIDKRQDFHSNMYNIKTPGYNPINVTAGADANYMIVQRLMRLYARNNLHDKLKSLAFRLARLESPFGSGFYYHSADAAMSYFMSQTDHATLRELKPLLADEKWAVSRLHLDWILAGGVNGDLQKFKQQQKKNSPLIISDSVTAVVSDYSALGILSHGQSMFTGHPWGISVFAKNGDLIKYIPLETEALKLAADDQSLWVGSSNGIYQIDLKSWLVRKISYDHPISNTKKNKDQEEIVTDQSVNCMVMDGDNLWFGSTGYIGKINTKSLELNIYTSHDLNGNPSENWQSFHIAKDGSVLAWGKDQDLRRYNVHTDTWTQLAIDSSMKINTARVTRVIGNHDGELWVNVILGEPIGNRPAIVNTSTWEITPIRYSSKKKHRVSEMGKWRGFTLAGSFQGNAVFESNHHLCVHDKKINRIVSLSSEWDKNQLKKDSKYSHTWSATRNEPFQRRSADYEQSELDYHNENFFTGITQLDPKSNKPPILISKGIAGSSIYDALPTRWGVWLCTNAGVSLVTKSGELIANYDRRNGFPCNSATSAIEADGKVYFACGQRDNGGGLVIFDPDTGLFTTLRETDGLVSNYLYQLENVDNRIKIIFAKYSGGTTKQHFAPMFYSPKNQTFSERTKNLYNNSNDYERKTWPPMPLLGGDLLKKVTIDNKTWWLGSRGVLIVDNGNQKFDTGFQTLGINYVMSARQSQIKQASLNKNLEELSPEEYFNHKNPFITARFLNEYQQEFTDEQLQKIAQMLHSEESPLRIAATRALVRQPSVLTGNFLKPILAENNRTIRLLASPVVAEFASDLPVEQLDKVLHSLRKDERENIKNAITKRDNIDKKAIELLLKYPPTSFKRSSQPSFPKLAKSITNNPELAKQLLTANDTTDYYGTNRQFMTEVFKELGKENLPLLHETLRSKNRVIRANAALACASLKDKSSVKPLIAALDLESGLSKRAIVIALGEIGDKQAVKPLIKLYNEQQMANSSRFQSGVHLSNAVNYYDNDTNLYDKLPVDKNGEKDEFLLLDQEPTKRVEMDREELLNLNVIVEALIKIGPEHAQEIFRTRASTHHSGHEAIKMLALGAKQDREKNIAVLQMLCALEQDPSTPVIAALSLYRLGERDISNKTFNKAFSAQGQKDFFALLKRELSNETNRIELKSYLEEIGINTKGSFLDENSGNN